MRSWNFDFNNSQDKFILETYKGDCHDENKAWG